MTAVHLVLLEGVCHLIDFLVVEDSLVLGIVGELLDHYVIQSWSRNSALIFVFN